MPFYTYETISAAADVPVRRYELWRNIKDPPFDRHPVTGEPLRRIFPAACSDPRRSASAPHPAVLR